MLQLWSWALLLLLLCLYLLSCDAMKVLKASSSGQHRVEELERAACRHHSRMCVDGLKFTDVYSSIFHARRNSVHNVVQIGIAKGESLKIWHDYFPNANIYALANNAKLGNSTFKALLKSTSSRLKLHIGLNVSFITLLQETNIKPNTIDVVFESGCNGLRSCHEKVLLLMFQFLRPGGHYIMEGVSLSRNANGGDFLALDGGVLSAATREILTLNHPFFVDASPGHRGLWKQYYNSSSNISNIAGDKSISNASAAIDFEALDGRHNLHLLVVRKRVGAVPQVDIQTGSTYLNKGRAVLAPVASSNRSSLEDLAFAFGTHKSKDDHKYTDFYASLLQPLRHKHLVVAEVGVGSGQSLQLWREYFTRAKIYGIDDDREALAFVRDRLSYLLANETAASSNGSNGSRVVLVEADSTGGEAMRAFLLPLQRTLDLVVDNGCASRQCQERTLANLWGAVKPGGHYVIENLQGSKGGLAFAESPSELNATTVDILVSNHAFLVNTALGHRRWDWWAGVNKQAVRPGRSSHSSHLLVVRKRVGHHASGHHAS